MSIRSSSGWISKEPSGRPDAPMLRAIEVVLIEDAIAAGRIRKFLSHEKSEGHVGGWKAAKNRKKERKGIK